MVKQTSLRSAALFYLLVVGFCTSPIWLGGYFINQDGAAHANNSWIMSGLAVGDPHFTELYEFNLLTLPNSIGHWLLAGLLLIFSPYTASKIMVLGIFAGSVASAGYLRYKTVGQNGLHTAILIGAAVSLNWLWLIGLYNFYIGLIIVFFAIGFFESWREDLTFRRTVALAFIFLLAYFSHLIAVMALAAGVFVISMRPSGVNRISTLAKSLAAMVPLIPLALMYRSLSVASEARIVPTWLSLSDIWSPVSWFHQIRTADPFIIISRKTFPFIETLSNVFLLFTPIVWLGGALMLLAALTYFYSDRVIEEGNSRFAFVILVVTFLAFALFGPDHFGSEHGGILRQRVLILSFLLFIPIFRAGQSGSLKRVSQVMLVFVIAFQTLALYDYTTHSDAVSREFIAAQSSFPETGGIASITVVDKPPKYQSLPEITVNNLNGIGRKLIVWDNYELGYYLFPVVAKRAADKEFVYAFTQNSTLLTKVHEPRIEEKLAVLDQLFGDPRIDILMIWGDLQGPDLVRSKHFEAEPFYRSQNIRIFKRRTNITNEIEGK